MNKNPKPKPNSGIEISASRTPKKKTVQADPFVRLHLHPLEELESRDSDSQSENDKNALETKDLDPTRPYTSADAAIRPETLLFNDVSGKSNKIETSPVKNFTKVPNSVAKKAIPDKLFKGLSKHTYDILYQLTRGAINPIRTIQLSKRELVKLTGLASNTLQTHFKYLKENGLVKVQLISGKHDGSIYEVFVPEELDNPTQVYPTRHDTTLPNTTRNSVPDTILLPYSVGYTNPLENKGLSIPLKTSLKTNTKSDDDAYALALFAARLDDLARRHTGKGLSAKDSDKWAEVAELLVMEFDIAAARTKSISSVPSFLKTHLERRLFGKLRHETAEKARSPKTGKNSPVSDEVAERFVAEPLNEESKKATLSSLRQYLAAGNTWVYAMSDNYTPEDWTWLMGELEKNGS